VLGGMMWTAPTSTTCWRRSLASLKHSVKIVLRHASDRLGHARGTRLVRASAGRRLLYSLSKHSKVSLALNTSIEGITRSNNAVESVTLQQNGQLRTVQVANGVILASGGSTATRLCARPCCQAWTPCGARPLRATPARRTT
jgi:2-polyprenyl-6-methoxyphenol hydroxylase-like FAD-dependent oxidoreductase